MEFMNENKWEHCCSNGTVFTCERCDFTVPIVVSPPLSLKPSHFWQDLAEMIGYHAIHIHPNLNGFAGYDTIEFEIKSPD